MGEIKINGEYYHELNKASSLMYLTKQELVRIVSLDKKIELERFVIKIGNTSFISRSGIDHINKNRIKWSKRHD